MGQMPLFAVASGRVVVCDDGVVSVPGNGGQRVQLAEDACRSSALIAADDDYAYWISDTCWLRRAPLAGGGPAETLSQFVCDLFETPSPVLLTSSGSRILVVLFNASSVVEAVRKDAPDKTRRAVAYLAEVWIAADDAEVFGFRGSGVDGLPTLVATRFDGGTERVVTSPGWLSTHGPSPIDIDATHAYVLRHPLSDRGRTQIVRVPKGGGDGQVVADVGVEGQVLAFSVDSRWLYALERVGSASSDTDLTARPKTGGDVRVLARCPDAYPGTLATDATHIYFATSRGIHRVPRP
jgi:hypothetical protein